MKKSPDDYKAKARASKPAMSQEEQDRLVKEKIKQERKYQTVAASSFRAPGVQHISSAASKPAYNYAKAGGSSESTESGGKDRGEMKLISKRSSRMSTLSGCYDDMIDEYNSSGSIACDEPEPPSMCDRVMKGNLGVSLRSSSIGGIYDDMVEAEEPKFETISEGCGVGEGDDDSGEDASGLNSAFSNYKIGDDAPGLDHDFSNWKMGEVDDESGSKRPKKSKHRKKSKEEGSSKSADKSKSRRSRRTIANVVDDVSKSRSVKRDGRLPRGAGLNGDDDELSQRIMEKLREKDRRRKKKEKKEKKRSRKTRIKEIREEDDDDDSFDEKEEENRRELIFLPAALLQLL